MLHARIASVPAAWVGSSGQLKGGQGATVIRFHLGHAEVGVAPIVADRQLKPNKYLQATSKTKRDVQARLVDAILPVHLLPGKTAEAVAPQWHPDLKSANLQTIENNSGDDRTRTRGLCRDRLGINVLSATYILSGAAKSLKGTVGTVRCG